ncbi:uncharacterized protein LOC133817936 isoform X2 [Humulus lupulus]|uniref:uncharacterized protein LOC133817936 isoform X2 n=1 Tax=Humulus lupulus TaxID=3486 RepID=UPI002B40ADC4|nr:uncharacterized protein LOC133817936 isoform X2 [Humulus lupulus]
MGTEVQSKMYLPGYYSTKDISNKASYGGWSLHHEGNSSKSVQHYGMFSSKPALEGVDYCAYDKEKLRQTILKHESILRHQVHELHRLYKIQRDMMNEFQSKEQIKHLIPSGTSQSSMFQSGFSTEDDKRSWYISNLPGAGSGCGRPSSSSADVIQIHQSHMHEKTTLSTYGLSQNSARLKDCESLDFKCKKAQRRLFDLEVPADEYIDDETETNGELEISRTESCLINNGNEVTVAADKNVFKHTGDNGNTLTSNLYSGRTHYLADLNEPIEVEEVPASASVDNMGDKTQTESTQAYSAQIGSKSSFSDSFHLQDFQKPCDLSKAEAGKTNEFVTCIPSDQNTAGKQITRKIFGIEVSEENNNASALAPKGTILQNMSVPQSDAANSDITSISCLNQNLISFQGAQYNPQGYLSGPRKEPRKMEAPHGGLPWLRKALSVNSKSLKEESEGSHQMKIDFTQSYSKQYLNQIDMRRGPSQSPIQDSWSTTRGHDTEHRRAETSDCSSVKRILGVPIFDFPSIHGSVVSVSGNNSPINVGSVKSDLACDSVSPRSQEQPKVIDSKKELDKGRSYVRQEIDLNECITEEEEEEDQVTPALLVVKPTTGIDLEAPVIIVDSETGITSEEESQESELMKPLPHDKIDEVAAEALVAISSSHVDYLHGNATLVDLQSDSSMNNSLFWFADVISSYDETATNKTNVCDEGSIPDDIDDFEYIILNLPETKVEECCYQPQILEDLDNLKEEDTPAPRRPRRGQARRGRQRKDFQRDVLPGLVSLSRNEVTEDLQIIEGMVRTTGGTWQPSLATRNGGKSGGGRGRRRLVGCAPSPPAPVAAACNVQVQLPDSKELGLDESSLTGWGKRTRRPPRQRCPLSNSLLPLK